MNPLYLSFCVLLSSIAYVGWFLGFVMAHNEVARECERLGGFYVGQKTFVCSIKGVQHGKS